MPRIVLPLPLEDFDPTESAVPWRHLRAAGVEVVFATPGGKPAACDPMTLDGVVFGTIGAKPDDAATYHEMVADPAFRNPMSYEDIDVADFDGVHLTGGHAPGMRPYLESEALQSRIAQFVRQDKVVSGICHGPIVLARTLDPDTGRSVVHGRHLTALTKLLERSGYWLTLWTLGKRFRTYPAYVQDEMQAALGEGGSFATGPIVPSYDNPFTVRDGNLLTGRWPGDADKLGRELAAMLTR